MSEKPHSTNARKADPRFSNFILLQAQNAGLFLGQLPHPSTGEKHVSLPAAQSVIDSLEMLADKTQGNLTTEEDNLLQKAISNLQNLYKTAEDLG